MYGLNPIVRWLTFSLILTTPCLAEEDFLVKHLDPLSIDPHLTLPEVISRTLDKYPEGGIIPAMREEAAALKRRGDSWLGGAPSASFWYWSDMLADDKGIREMEGMLEFPLWNWGQREAGQHLAEQAQRSTSLYAQAIRLQVAGLVREVLWDLKIQRNRHAMAKKIYEVSKKLMHTVKRRVELGDLPRADLLLAQSELLQKRSELVNAEAEEMHARKRYSTVTQLTAIPAEFTEKLSLIKDINQEHPLLATLNTTIARKQAELKWIKAEGNGQPVIGLGGKSDRGSRIDPDETGMMFSVSVPFGGSTFSGPEIAKVNLELNQAIVTRNRFYRQLRQRFHEAEHALEVDQVEMQISHEQKQIAEEHLKITRLSFDSGEIGLIDYLRIQTRSFAAIKRASEQALILQRDIALYNQTVGIMP